MILKVPPSVSLYRIRRVTGHLRPFLDLPEPLNILDVGCGAAEITKSLQQIFPRHRFTGVDVVVRPHRVIEVVPYDGTTLPFADKSFDVVMMVDMLHHTDDPAIVLMECARVARRFIVLKDHISDSWFDRARLTFLDWFGNRPFGIPMTYTFFSSRQWRELFARAGLTVEKQVRHLQTCPPPFYYPLDHDLHFIAQLRVPPQPAAQP
jgi:SAM-dependent methyltransferase